MAGRVNMPQLKVPQLSPFGIRRGHLASVLVADSRQLARQGLLLASKMSRNNLPELIFAMDHGRAAEHLGAIALQIDPPVAKGHLRLVDNYDSVPKVFYYLARFFSALGSDHAENRPAKQGVFRIDRLITDLNNNEYPGGRNIFQRPRMLLEHAEDFLMSFHWAYRNTLDAIARDIGPSKTIDIMMFISRGDFIPPKAASRFGKGKGIPSKYLYFVDAPLTLNRDYNVSRISTIAIVLDELKVMGDMNVLEIGTGSGWPTALLANMVGPKGSVCTVEVDADLFNWAKMTLRGRDIRNVKFKKGDGLKGFASEAPFDRIVLWGGVSSLAEAAVLFDQLKEGGIIAIPSGDDILVVEKKGSKRIEKLHTVRRLANNWFDDLKKP